MELPFSGHLKLPAYVPEIKFNNEIQIMCSSPYV